MVRIVAVHGAATTSRMWDAVAAWFRDHEFIAVERPRTGSLEEEIAAITPYAEDAWLMGISGGATLGLALTASDLHLRGAVLHEPAVGTLLPELLQPFGDAFARGGTLAFGRALYGRGWSLSDAPEGGDEVTLRELRMFAAFDPEPLRDDRGHVLVTVGAESPEIRRCAGQRLQAACGYPVEILPGCGHLAVPQVAARLLREIEVADRGIEQRATRLGPGCRSG